MWINYNHEKVVYASNLAPAKQYAAITYFTHTWIFKKSDTNGTNRLFAEANGVKKEKDSPYIHNKKINLKQQK